jgi:hypothetical protein
MASRSPQEAARPRIVNGILGFVTLIGVLGLFVVVCVNLLTAVGGVWCLCFDPRADAFSLSVHSTLIALTSAHQSLSLLKSNER